MYNIKAHCALHDKWFILEVDTVDGQQQIVNFVNVSEEQAKSFSTGLDGTSFVASRRLRGCVKCNSRKAGCCDHARSLGRCDAQYSYQCLFCRQLKISRSAATSRFTEWAGMNLIPGAQTDRHGNAKGSQYDLAKDGGFAGFKIVILCLFSPGPIDVNVFGGGVDKLNEPIAALKKKGFSTELLTKASPEQLKKSLADACQLWVISEKHQILNEGHLRVIRDFYEKGHGLYLFGDNEPFYADVNYISKALMGTSMSGNTPGDKVISVMNGGSGSGILPGHPISTGIVNFYEGITIASIRTTATVRPLVTSSDGGVVTAIVDDGKHRALLDGGFTRLFFKWNAAGTDRFVVNAAAWLANADGDGDGGEVSFT